jgi:hypothetical protein
VIVQITNTFSLVSKSTWLRHRSRRNDPKTAAARAARSLNEQNSSNEEEDSETDQRLGDAIDHSEPSESRAIDIPPSDEDTSHSAGPSSQSVCTMISCLVILY